MAQPSDRGAKLAAANSTQSDTCQPGGRSNSKAGIERRKQEEDDRRKTDNSVREEEAEAGKEAGQQRNG